MKLTVVHNHLGDCLLYVNDEAYQDIDYRDAMTLEWLKDVVQERLTINFRLVEMKRPQFPNKLSELPATDVNANDEIE